jgi:hypothetical protein
MTDFHHAAPGVRWRYGMVQCERCGYWWATNAKQAGIECGKCKAKTEAVLAGGSECSRRRGGRVGSHAIRVTLQWYRRDGFRFGPRWDDLCMAV